MANRRGKSGGHDRFYFLGLWMVDGPKSLWMVTAAMNGGWSKITLDGDCGHEIERPLLHRRKAMTNLNNVLKSRDITWLTKVCTVKAMVFPVVMYGCKSRTIRKAECWSLDAFKLWCWRTLKSPLDSKEIKPVNPKVRQPWIFIGRTDAEAEASILWPTDTKSWHIWKTLMLGKIEGSRRRG